VYLIDGGERRLTGTNDALMAELRLPDIDAVKVTMPDGRTVEGWVIKPLDMEPGRRYPLVLDIHGGPHGAFLHAFRAAYPLALPALGCAVLQLNPSGSTGWGEDFARSLHGVRGELDLPELMAAVDQLIAQGWVDPDQLGITGYSYGGYMTAWAITQTHRFKAAVCGAGTPNLYTHFAYSDMNIVRYAEMGSPWEQREHYLRLSPITYVQNVRTPLLLLHGEADLRANIAQADEFFTALKYFGVDTVLVRYPGENHMMRQAGRPSNRLDYDQRLIAWFTDRLAIGHPLEAQASVAG
jgi:dipeptidyl aminopeptidase/acylaminoacyl peptidase